MTTTFDLTNPDTDLDDCLDALDVALHTKRQHLPTATADTSPAVYLTFYAGPLRTYRRIASGTWPVAIGAATDGHERLRRHRRSCRPVRNLAGGAHLWVAVVPVASPARALYLEQLLIDLLETVWNQRFMAGFGSRYQGSSRKGQVPPPFALVHPGRRVGSGEPTVTAGFLRRRIIDHLERTARDLWLPIDR